MPGKRYEEIADDLREKIRSGFYPPGEPLPHSELLRAQYGGVGQGTFTKAMEILKDEQLVRRVANRGMIVQKVPAIVDLSLRISPADDFGLWEAACRRAGVDGLVVLAGVRPEPAEPDIAHALNIAASDTVVYRARRATIADQPVLLEETYWLYETFDETPPVAVVWQRTSAKIASTEEAAQLKLSQGSWVLAVERVLRDEAGRRTALQRCVANPLRVQFLEEELPLTPSA
ncbi:GntR family transcriptional regulator [Streptosporangium sp. H16]|uniref:GntR family transcriptional regulator n=1 Tax=Streptosporangium sp. H16 TaxID=3444184 RepID=UPI003F7AB814